MFSLARTLGGSIDLAPPLKVKVYTIFKWQQVFKEIIIVCLPAVSMFNTCSDVLCSPLHLFISIDLDVEAALIFVQNEYLISEQEDA